MQRKRILALIFIGCFIGVLLSLGSSVALDETNTTEFCISCHEMEQTVYQEYLRSPHYSNRSGVGAGCPDCHVPNTLGAKLIRKLMAANDIYHSLKGTIDTPEKFESRRAALAQRVWDRMKKSDSQTCRGCHSTKRMDPHKQSRRARDKMQKGINAGKTCIDCHQGVAHTLPDGWEDEF